MSLDLYFNRSIWLGTLSLEENILVPGYMNNKMTQKEVKDRSAKLMERMNITAAAKRLPSQVSGGEARESCYCKSSNQ